MAIDETDLSTEIENEQSDQLSDDELRQLAALIYKMILNDLKVERERGKLGR